MLKARKSESAFNIAFLDVVSCGFGAIILLLMITKTAAPIVVEVTNINSDGVIIELQKELFDIRGETRLLNRDLNAKHEQLSKYKEKIARLRRERSDVEGQFQTSKQESEENSLIEGELAIAKQQLSDEMISLLGEGFENKTDSIGGIPVDSEYIIFIIDTSGSMFSYSWGKMLEVFIDTLNIYPEVKGLQVMNDMGEYMFSSYRGKWIPDTPARRNAIISRLRNWRPFSNSSPVEGITRAIKTFYSADKKISLYVFGDEFTGPSISQVIKTVDRINIADKKGNRLVRIHAIGFPVQFSQAPIYQTTGIRFATLMRELTQKNGGTFVGLNEFH